MKDVKAVWLKIPAAIPVKQWYIYKCYLRSIDKSCTNDEWFSDILIENGDLTFLFWFGKTIFAILVRMTHNADVKMPAIVQRQKYKHKNKFDL